MLDYNIMSVQVLFLIVDIRIKYKYKLTTAALSELP